MASLPTILIASDNPVISEKIGVLIRESNRYPLQFATLSSTISTLAASSPDFLICDLSTCDMRTGTEWLRKTQQVSNHTIILPVIPENQRAYLRAMHSLGMHYTVFAPIDVSEFKETFLEAIQHQQQVKAQSFAQSSQQTAQFHGMIGASSQMQKLFNLIARIAEDDIATVLIRGESGTGKEMVARAIHAHSSRAHRNFVPVNCAAIPDDLLESELFGYTKGAFTGANANKQGRIQYADGGTLFLDEIGDMKSSLQAKLLRVIQEKEFEPVGALKPIPVDTRILAATHCDLEQFVKEGKFREDLYYRLSVIPVTIPSLKDRKEDIPLLIDAFSELFTTRKNREPFRFSPQAMAAMMHFDWRGNVRELENLIQHMSVLYSGREIAFDDLPEKFHYLREMVADITEEKVEQAALFPEATPVSQDAYIHADWQCGQVDFNSLISEFEIRLITQAMRMAANNKKEAARLLNLKRTTLLEKIKKKDLNFGDESE